MMRHLADDSGFGPLRLPPLTLFILPLNDRAIRTCRSEIASQRASPQRWTEEMAASHFQRSCSLAGMLPPSDSFSDRRRIGTAAS